MADVPVRFAGLRGTLAAFAVDLFAGRAGSLTDAPMCSGGYDRPGIYDGSAWRLGAAADYAGNVNALSLLINGTTVIDSSRNVKANELWSGGAIRVDASGDFTGRNQTLTGWLTLNGATRPAWAVPAAMLDSVTAIYQIGGAARMSRNLYYDGAVFRAINTLGGTDYAQFFGLGSDGSFSGYSSQTPAVTGTTITDMAIRWQLNRFGGLGLFGVTPPTARPTITGARGSTATEAALLAALSASGIILDSTTAPSTIREANIHFIPLTNTAPAVVNFVDANMKAWGFNGGASTNDLFASVDWQHDYIAGTDLDLHIHWAPSTAGTGNVKWQFYVSWFEAGTVAPASTLYTVTVAAGTQWQSGTASVTIPGAGHTYNSRMMVRVFRDPTDASDTYADPACVTAIGCHYSANIGA